MEHEPKPFFESDIHEDIDTSLPDYTMSEEKKEEFRKEGKSEQWIIEEENRRRLDLIEDHFRREQRAA